MINIFWSGRVKVPVRADKAVGRNCLQIPPYEEALIVISDVLHWFTSTQFEPQTTQKFRLKVYSRGGLAEIEVEGDWLRENQARARERQQNENR